MLTITGAGSRIAEEVRKIVGEKRCQNIRIEDYPPSYSDKFLICHGVLNPKNILEQTPEDVSESFRINCAETIRFCEKIFREIKDARVCIVGSESAYSWSYDDTYAAAKAAIHRYVETKRLPYPGQQMVCVAPTIIVDAGMTTRRHDQDRVKLRAAAHPKGRFLRSEEVAKMIHHLLYVDEGYTSGVVIRMNGGEHTRR